MADVNKCIQNGHDVVEDALVRDHCEERLLCCRTCSIYFICTNTGPHFTTKIQLPAKGVTNEQLSRLLTFKDPQP